MENQIKVPMKPVFLRKGNKGAKFYQREVYELGRVVDFECLVDNTINLGSYSITDHTVVTTKQGNDIYKGLVAWGYQIVTEDVYKELRP